MNDLGDPVEFVALLGIGEGATGEEKLENSGVVLREEDGKTIIDDVAFGSSAEAAGLDWDQEVVRVLKPLDQPTKYLMFIPALALLLLVIFLQRGRTMRTNATPKPA